MAHGAIKGNKNRPKTNKVAKCPLCSFETKRLPTFEKHLNTEHNTDSQTEWNRVNGGAVKCKCGCGNTTTWLGWHKGYGKLLRGHNGSIYAIYDEDKAGAIAKKRSQSLKGRPGWAKGLTKESSPVIAQRGIATSIGRKRAFDRGDITIWSKGKTKETSPQVAAMAQKQQEAYTRGNRRPAWKGLTKETSPEVAAMAAKVAVACNDPKLRNRLDKKKRLTPQALRERIEFGQRNLVIKSPAKNYRSDLHDISVYCDVCDEVITAPAVRFFNNRCPQCMPSNSSMGEQDVADFVKHELGLHIWRMNSTLIGRSQLDIYVPSKKFAIEFNGLYWHSERFKRSTYHEAKTVACTHQGIRLLHIFSDEWRDKPEIVKSIIRAKLGVGVQRLDARKCEVREVPGGERRSFFEENHLDGDAYAKFAIGLYMDDELVQCMSARVPPSSMWRKENFLENARTCPKLNTYVRGGLSRLSKHVLNNAKSLGFDALMTYVDRRLGGNTAYQQAGWQVFGTQDTTKHPRFWWTDDVVRHARQIIKADKSQGLSQSGVAAKQGYLRIFGCKNAIYTMR